MGSIWSVERQILNKLIDEYSHGVVYTKKEFAKTFHKGTEIGRVYDWGVENTIMTKISGLIDDGKLGFDDESKLIPII